MMKGTWMNNIFKIAWEEIPDAMNWIYGKGIWICCSDWHMHIVKLFYTLKMDPEIS